MLADAYSTALVVMGVEEGLAFANARGLAARLIDAEHRCWTSRAFAEMLDDDVDVEQRKEPVALGKRRPG